MGLGGISMWQLLIILAIVILVFGTKRLKNIGGDLGGALKSFRKAMDTNDDSSDSGTQGGSDADSAQGPARIESEGKPDAEFSEQADKHKQQ